jgi:hypothetical protein
MSTLTQTEIYTEYDLIDGKLAPTQKLVSYYVKHYTELIDKQAKNMAEQAAAIDEIKYNLDAAAKHIEIWKVQLAEWKEKLSA